MSNSFKYVLAAAALVLVGAGCENLPANITKSDILKFLGNASGTAQIGGEMGDQMKSATGSEMDKGQEGDRMKSATGSEMEDGQKKTENEQQKMENEQDKNDGSEMKTSEDKSTSEDAMDGGSDNGSEGATH